MNFLPILLGLTSVALFTSQVYAKEFYVCDTGGNDQNIGTSIDKPLKSYSKAAEIIRSMSGGDVVSFCRGGEFQVTDFKPFDLNKVTPENPGVIQDYFPPGSTGSEPLPHIFNTTNGVFYFGNRDHSSPDGGLIVKNLKLSGGGKGSGIFFYNGFTDVTFDNIIINGFGVGLHLSGGNNLSKNITIKNSQISNNFLQGLLGGASNFVIDNNKFINNGHGGEKESFLYHNIYLNDPIAKLKPIQQIENIVISNNYLYQSAMDNGVCGGASLAVHGRVNNIKIKNNTVEEDVGKANKYCYGIGLGTGYLSEEYFNEVEVTNNIVKNVGDIAIAGGSITNAVIANNHIIDESDRLRIGIAVPDKTERDPDARSKNVLIDSNNITLRKTDAVGIRLIGEHQFRAIGNEIRLPKDTNAKCFVNEEANKDTDIETNICNLFDEISFIDNSSDNTETEVVQDNFESPIAEIDTEKFSVIRGVVVNTDGQILKDLNLKTSRGDNTNLNSSIGLTDTDNKETAGEENNFSRVSSSSGSGSGSTSSSSSSSSSSESTELIDDFQAYNINPVRGPLATSQQNSSFESSVTDRSSNQITIPYSSSSAENTDAGVKVRDVHEAARSDYTNIDPSQCRASANGRCLMR